MSLGTAAARTAAAHSDSEVVETPAELDAVAVGIVAAGTGDAAGVGDDAEQPPTSSNAAISATQVRAE